MQLVGSFATYGEAQGAVDFLADRHFPVEQVAIVAGELRFIEQVTGRRGFLEMAADGATSGAVVGALLGFLLGVFTLITPLASGLALAFWGFVLGGVIGGLVGIVTHAFWGSRRSFRSVPRLDAGRYDVMAEPAVAERARQLLEERGRRTAA